mmetsp:Transcript_70088/g.113803  ORF Transcript_70088/g.113803 Transcript_70088/m.113803 type:complete len:208 (-) Transcript_70088:4826-5449(-)
MRAPAKAAAPLLLRGLAPKGLADFKSSVAVHRGFRPAYMPVLHPHPLIPLLASGSGAFGPAHGRAGCSKERGVLPADSSGIDAGGVAGAQRLGGVGERAHFGAHPQHLFRHFLERIERAHLAGGKCLSIQVWKAVRRLCRGGKVANHVQLRRAHRRPCARQQQGAVAKSALVCEHRLRQGHHELLPRERHPRALGGWIVTQISILLR